MQALVGAFLCCSTHAATPALSSARPSASACLLQGVESLWQLARGTHAVEATALLFVLFIPERFSGLLVA